MPLVSSLQTLNLIIDDISAEINLSIIALDSYHKAPNKIQFLDKSQLHLKRLKGVFTLLEMPGASRLVTDSISVVKNLPKCKQSTRQRFLEGLSIALVRLNRYCQHVNQKEKALPQLLLPSINELRTTVNVPLLDESVFFECNSNKARKNQSLPLIVNEENVSKSSHYRQMYQIGLIEVLRQTNLVGGLNMMKKSMIKLDEACPIPISQNLWWIAQGMLDGYIKEGLILTKSRLKLFSRLDRQIRHIENKPVNQQDDSKQETQRLAHEMLYLTWISQVDSKNIKELLAHFGLSRPLIGDKAIREESEELRGPTDQDYSSMVEALLEEIEKIDQALVQACDKDLALLDLEQAMNQMINLNNLLKILQVDDQILRLNVAIDLIEKSIKQKKNLSQKDTNILFLVLKGIREAVDEPKLAKYSGNATKQRVKISEPQMKICESTDKLVKELIRDVTLFVESQRKRQHLKNVEQLIIKIQKGFNQLNITQSEPILDGCLSFVSSQLIGNSNTISNNAIELFADVIGSLEFYLDTLKFTSEPNSRILEFAENSLLQLQMKLRI